MKDLTFEKKQLQKKAEYLITQIAMKENQIKKYDDDLNGHKQNKHFLDILAIQAKKKDMQKQVKPVVTAESTAQRANELLNKTMNKQNDATFMTQVGS